MVTASKTDSSTKEAGLQGGFIPFLLQIVVGAVVSRDEHPGHRIELPAEILSGRASNCDIGLVKITGDVIFVVKGVGGQGGIF